MLPHGFSTATSFVGREKHWEGEGFWGLGGLWGHGKTSAAPAQNCHCYPNPTPGHFLHVPQRPNNSRDRQTGQLCHQPWSEMTKSAQIPAKGRHSCLCQVSDVQIHLGHPSKSCVNAEFSAPKSHHCRGEQRPTPKSHVNPIQPWTPRSQTPPLPWGADIPRILCQPFLILACLELPAPKPHHCLGECGQGTLPPKIPHSPTCAEGSVGGSGWE